jgi:hypothetical protein
MIRKTLLECTSCWGSSAIEHDDDGESTIIEVKFCPLCGVEVESDLPEMDEEEDE